MKFLAALSSAVAVLAFGLISGDGQTTNHPPRVSILWPQECDEFIANYFFNHGTYIKIKATADDPDGTVAQVQFFANTNLIGIVTNAPYNFVFRVPIPSAQYPNYFFLKAVAFDNAGATTESGSVFVRNVGGFPYPAVFGITSPPNGTVFSAPATFEMSAEYLASLFGDTGSANFYAGTNFLGTVNQTGPFAADTPLYSLLVINLPEGDYPLRIEGVSSAGFCHLVTIHVAKLGFQSPRVRPDGGFEFDVVTSFPTNQNVIQMSSNMFNWMPISTNVPMTNTFTFTEPWPATNTSRFYRAVVPFH